MALLGKGVKAAGAVAIVSVLSIIIVCVDLTTEGYLAFIKVYGIGAAVGLLVSVAATALMKRKVPHLRAKNFALTLGALFGGAALLSMEFLSKPLVGEKAADTGVLILNYALGYFIVGVTIDARRVLKARRLRRAKK